MSQVCHASFGRSPRDINEVFNDYWQWIEDTLTTKETTWLKVICAMVK